MGARDYYLILGVSRTESASGIRAAFRERVKTHHPDHAGPEGAPAFREVVEAYRVLADPGARRRYDDELRRSEAVPPRTAGVRVQRFAPEPLVPEPVSVFGDPDEIRPSYEALRHRFRSNFEEVLAPKSEHPEPLHFQVSLSPREARIGGVLPIRVPVFRRCPECGGAGHTWGFWCGYCGQEGVIQDHATVRLRIPAGVRSGEVIDLSLDRCGIRNLWIRAIIRTLE